MRFLRATCASVLLAAITGCSGGDASVIVVDASTPPPDAPSIDAVPPDAPTDTPPPPTDRPPPGPTDVGPLMDLCPGLCVTIMAAPGCMRDMATCVHDCNAQIDATPAPCRGALNEWFACGRTSPVTCSGLTLHFSSCEAQQTAFINCVASPDGGADPCAAEIDCMGCVTHDACGWCNNHCVPGTASGPTPPVTCGATAWARSPGACP